MSNVNLALLIAMSIRCPITRWRAEFRYVPLLEHLACTRPPPPVVVCFNYFLALSPELCSFVLAFYLRSLQT